MNQILSFVGGLIVAWLFVGTIGRVATGRWIVLAFLLVLPSQAAVLYQIRNAGGTTLYVDGSSPNGRVEHNNSSSVQTSYKNSSANSGTDVGSLAAGATCWVRASVTWQGVAFTVKRAASPETSLYSFGSGEFSTANGEGNYVSDKVINLDGSGLYTTNCLAELNFSEAVNYPGDWEIRIYRNSVFLHAQTFFGLGQGDTMEWHEAHVDCATYTYEIFGPGAPESNTYFEPKGGGNFDNSNPETPGTPDNGTPDTTDNDPIDGKPDRTITNDDKTAARENAEAIIDAIDRANHDLGQILRGVGTNILALNLTNVVDLSGLTNLLSQIMTNGATLTNQMSWTNWVSARNASSNVLQGIGVADMNAGSNEFNSSAMATFMNGARTGALSSATNQGAFTMGINPLAAALVLPNGATRYFNGDLLDTSLDSSPMASIKGQLKKWANFCREWILRLIPFVMFWLCAKKVLGVQRRVSEMALQLRMGPLRDIQSTLGRYISIGFIAGLTAIIIGIIIGLIPTALVANMQSITNGHAGAMPSMVYSVAVVLSESTAYTG